MTPAGLLEFAAKIRAAIAADRAAARRHWPRRGERWSIAEDQLLLRRLGRRPSDKAFWRAAKQHGRTYSSIQTRWYILRVAEQHRRLSAVACLG